MKFKQTEIGEIAENWKVRKLSEFCDILMGQSPPSSTYNFNTNGLPFFQGRKDFGTKYPKKSMWCSEPTRIANKGNVLLSVRAPIGDVNVAIEKCCIGRGLSALSMKNGNKEFLYYLLLHYQQRLKQIFESEGTVFGCVTKDGLRNFDVILPVKAMEQRAIAKILSDLDEKIELNNQMNKTLEAIGQAIFKRWFVDFEFPCLPSDYVLGAGKPDDLEKICTYKSVGGLPAPQPDKYFLYVLLCADESFYIGITDDLYYRWYQHKTGHGAKWTKANEPIKVIHYEEFSSRTEAAHREQWLKTGFGRKWLKREYAADRLRQAGRLVDSELGEIPEGWTVSNLEDIGTFKNGINYLRNEAGDTEFFIANVRDIANNKLLLKESLDKIKINLSKAKDYLLQEKDILIARSASPGEISLVLGDLKNVIYSGFSIRYRLDNPSNYLYIFHVMQGLKRNLQNYSIGTTLQSVNQGTLKNMKLILPSDETLKEFNKISKQILYLTLNNLLQNRELSQIRDSLLPKLMSGKIRIGYEN